MKRTPIEKQVRFLIIYATLSTLLFAGILIILIKDQRKTVIRSQGLVITDEQGRDRILIGSPIPTSKDRMRTNLERVKNEWAKGKDSLAYMTNYTEELRHDVGGILFLNEDGFDKLVLGETIPDPNTGRRIVESSGFAFNDDRGYEMGGLGVSKTETGAYRVVFGMDDPKVGEAMHMFVLEDGTKGIQVAYEEGRLLLGRSPKNGFFNTTEEFVGIKVENLNGEILWQENALKRKE